MESRVQFPLRSPSTERGEPAELWQLFEQSFLSYNSFITIHPAQPAFLLTSAALFLSIEIIELRLLCSSSTVLRDLTLFNRSVKSCFNSSDCRFTTSQAPVCKIRDSAVGCSATMSRILSEMSETISLVKQSTLVFFLLQKLSPTISVWQPVISSLCGGLLLLDLVSYLPCSLTENLQGLDKVEQICSADVFFLIWVGLLLLLVFAAVHGCVLLGTGVEEALFSQDSAGQPVAS